MTDASITDLLHQCDILGSWKNGHIDPTPVRLPKGKLCNNQLLLEQTLQDRVVIWNTTTIQPIQTYHPPKPDGDIICVFWHPTDLQLCICTKYMARVVECHPTAGFTCLTQWPIRHSFSMQLQTPHFVAFRTGGSPYYICPWRRLSGFIGKWNVVNTVLASNDLFQLVVTRDDDYAIHIWKVGGGPGVFVRTLIDESYYKCIWFEGRNPRVSTVTWSLDGQFIATRVYYDSVYGSIVKMMRNVDIWNVRTGEQLTK